MKTSEMTSQPKDFFAFTRHIFFILRRFPITTALVAILILFLFFEAYKRETMLHTTVYVLALAASFLVVEYIAFFRALAQKWQIKDLKQETGVIFFSIGMVIILLVLRFLVFSDFQNAHVAVRLLIFGLVLLFVYPVFLAIYFLFWKKYKLSELGVRWSTFWVAFPIIAIIGLSTYFFVPEELQFSKMLEAYGPVMMVVTGFFTAAIPEEFLRMLTQSRLAAIFSNTGLGWLTASLIWALMHFPNFYNQTSDAYGAFVSTLGILPIGLLWGYLTERFKSIVPAVLIHGTNLWGLQNIF